MKKSDVWVLSCAKRLLHLVQNGIDRALSWFITRLELFIPCGSICKLMELFKSIVD
jgi:hypothetical protein